MLPFPLFRRGYRRPLIDGRAEGCYYARDDVPLMLGRPPPAQDLDDVTRAKRVVGIVDEVLFRLFKELFWQMATHR